ncbi:starvation-inducible DNA-binding protein [Sphingobacterium alimentarium]|uniref:Starvation-inducible DNA-binding protein n=1 Tax=Sphingobacterium alimentarium TaxID=797292 RepID=A0A4R3VU69_9SPHI|nr:DNA starvation/stationary phase protection protein [Sphingobacterium alimentarium]TCV16545.1 starvation-inducible DNA-binding protein [Sphingobacterium alimentarium]
MKTNIGLKDKDTAAVAEVLNKLLADHNVLYVKTRNAHWNVVGPDFHAQHLFFETIYDALAETIDEIAERVRSIGHFAIGSMKEFLELTQLSEAKPAKNDSQSYIKALLNDFESIIISIREDFDKIEKTGDAGTEDFLVSIMEAHEKTAWMLRAHLA